MLCILVVQDLIKEVQRTLCVAFLEHKGNLEEESELETLIDTQLTMLQKTFRIQQKVSGSDEANLIVSKKLLTLFRLGKLGPFILDNLPDGYKNKSC